MAVLSGPGSVRAGFNALQYIASYDDLIAAFGASSNSGVDHYNQYGFAEGRQQPFSGLQYIASYSDLISAFRDNAEAGAQHYIQYGHTEGRARATFSGLQYIAAYDDLISALGANADVGAQHFILFGSSEGRTARFHSYEYLASYGDLIAAFGDNADAGAQHFITYGHTEHRAITFDAAAYLNAYADLRAAFGNDLEKAAQHYIDYGRLEGRQSFTIGQGPAAPTLTVQTASGTEDGTVALQISAALGGTTGTLSIGVQVPAGGSLNHGTSDGAGRWTLAPADLSGLVFTPPHDLSGTVTLAVTATKTDQNGSTTTAGSLAVAIAPVSDVPTLTLIAPTITGAEDTPIPLTLQVAQGDVDGSETLSLQISGVPVDAHLSAGTVDGNGVWTVPGSAFATLALIPATNFSGTIGLTVTAVSQDGAASPAVSASQSLTVTVAPVSDAPAITVANATGIASTNTSIALSIAVAVTDPSETLGDDVRIVGVPSAYALNHGTLGDDGVWVVSVADLPGLLLVSTSPSAFGAFQLTVLATSLDAGTTVPATGTATLNVSIAAPANVRVGQTIDGYISGATVFADANGNGILDNGEVSTTTAADGTFTLTGAGANVPLVMFGGTDISTGVAFTGKLSAVGGSSVITPLTTLVQTLVASGAAADAGAAEAKVKAAFNITDPSVTLSSFDPVAATAAGSATGAAVLAAGIQVQATVTQLAAASTTSGTQVTTADVVSALASTISNATSAVNLADASTIAAVAGGTNLSSAAVAGVQNVVASANASIASASTAGGSSTDVLTRVTQAATTAINTTTAAISTTDFSNTSQTGSLNSQYTGTNLDTKVDTASVAVVVPPIIGTIGADTIDRTADTASLVISGLDGNDTLTGGSANDRIYGGGGDDVFKGKAGNDLFDGGTGFDRAIYTGLGASIGVDLAAGTVTRSGGTDTLVSVESVRGTAFDDSYTAVGYTATTHLSAGQVLNEQGDFNEFEGLGGNDSITGNGNTRASYLNALAGVTVNLASGAQSTAANDAAGIGVDTFVSGVTAVRGSQFDDVMKGTSNGSANPEVFDGRGGNDLIDGGAGFDRARYDGAALTGLGIVVTMAPVDGGGNPLGYATVTGRDDAATAIIGTDRLISIESVVGSNAADILDATGYTATTNLSAGQTTNDLGAFTEFQGLGGDDTITGNGSTRLSFSRALDGVTITLTALGTGTSTSTQSGDTANVGNDTFTGIATFRGSAFSDTFTGSTGNDSFEPNGGNDTVNGGAGSDLVRFDNAIVGATGITVNMAAGTVTSPDPVTSASVGTTTLLRVEQVRGTSGADTYDATGFGSTSTNAGDAGPGNSFEGLGGNDTITGNGSTTLVFSNANAGVTVDFTSHTAYGTAAGDAANVGTDTFSNVSGVTGSNSSDRVITNGATGFFNLAGGANDVVTLAASGSQTFVLGLVNVETVNVSGTANETLNLSSTPSSSTGSVSIDLGAGTDVVGLGADGVFNLTLANVETVNAITGTGDQTLNLNAVPNGLSVDMGSGNDTLNLFGTNPAGTNVLTISRVESFISGNANTAVTFLADGSANHSFSFGTGTNVLQLGGSGGQSFQFGITGGTATTIQGTAGADTVTFNGVVGGKTIDLGAGTDTLNLGSGTGFNVVSVANVETINGSANGDTITLLQSTGITTVKGAGGTDNITATASTGEDHFLFSAIGDSTIGAFDQITGFNAANDGFYFTTAGIAFAGAALDYIGTAAFTAGSGHAQAHLALGGTQLQIDVNNDGAIDAAHDMVVMLANIQGVIAQGNFHLI